MEFASVFKNIAKRIESNLRNFNINPKYLSILSFILCLKAYFELVNNKVFSFLFLMIFAQLITEIYLINVKHQSDSENQNYYLINQKLNYIKFMIYLIVLFMKYNSSFKLINFVIVIFAFLIYTYYATCYSDILNQNSEIDFELANGTEKVKRIFSKKNKILNNFLFNDICSVFFLLLVVILFQFL